MPMAAFLMFCLTTSFTPGPNNVMSMNCARHNGVRATVPLMFGVGSGFFIILMLSAVFNMALERLIPDMKLYMAVLGTLYLLYLAVKPFLPHRSAKSVGEGALKRSYFAGLLLQFVNPKGVLYCLTVMSTFVLPYYSSLPVFAAISLVLAVVCMAANLCWALFGAAFQRCFAEHELAVNVVMALLLAYCAWSILSSVL